MIKFTCTFPGCDKPIKVKYLLLCNGHYEQIRLGRVEQPLERQGDTDEQYLWKKVDKHCLNDHWLWEGYVDEEGYGRIRGGPKPHRLAYELLIGPIPQGYDIHHRCGEKLCVNPEHLEVIEHSDHVSLHNKQRETH